MRTRQVILYRKCNSVDEDAAEITAAVDAGFVVIKNRTLIQPGDLVIPRYSSVPFYKELDSDTNEVGAILINSYQQHQYIADLRNWVTDLRELTFETWDRIEDVPDEGPFVLKGFCNSRKGQWRTRMFAENKQEAIKIFVLLSDDGLIGEQGVCIRRFVPLVNYGQDVAGMPNSKEFRLFCYKGKVLSSGFYWSNWIDELKEVPSPSEIPASFIEKVLDRIKDKTNFVVLDIAQTYDLNWIVVELNCGTQSGLSCNDPNILYRNLYNEIIKRPP